MQIVRMLLRLLSLSPVIPALYAAAALAAAPQDVSDGELQRFIYMAAYPIQCGAAGDAARDMRVNTTTDPVKLHAVMQANIDQCANTQWVQQRPAVWNTAVFSAASAALLAARHEDPGQALSDATNAQQWSAVIAGFTRQSGPGRPGPGMDMPSMYRTNAGRIYRDATSLIGTLQSPAATPPPQPE